jgi:hypothetical protein
VANLKRVQVKEDDHIREYTRMVKNMNNVSLNNIIVEINDKICLVNNLVNQFENSINQYLAQHSVVSGKHVRDHYLDIYRESKLKSCLEQVNNEAQLTSTLS